MSKNEYNFSDHAEIMKALDELYEIDSHPTAEIRRPLEDAIKKFFQTRTNSELMDLGDLEPSIWDHSEWLVNPWYKEWYSRAIPETENMRELLNDYHEEWAGKDSIRTRFLDMEKQVQGLQKKLDKVTKLLENFEVKMSVSDALKL